MTVHDEMAETPDRDLLSLWSTARAAVLSGVYWDGNYDNIGGVTKDEALELAAEFFRALDRTDVMSHAPRDGEAES